MEKHNIEAAAAPKGASEHGAPPTVPNGTEANGHDPRTEGELAYDSVPARKTVRLSVRYRVRGRGQPLPYPVDEGEGE
jgi:hypothetical protein